jgi:hypothetical protein
MASISSTAWDVNANGFHSLIEISAVDDNNGQVDGTMFDENGSLRLENPDDPKGKAVWEEDARRFRFARTLQNGERQTFTGFFFDSSGVPNKRFAMAGTFVGDRFEDPRRPAFGWFPLGDTP